MNVLQVILMMGITGFCLWFLWWCWEGWWIWFFYGLSIVRLTQRFLCRYCLDGIFVYLVIVFHCLVLLGELLHHFSALSNNHQINICLFIFYIPCLISAEVLGFDCSEKWSSIWIILLIVDINFVFLLPGVLIV